MDASAYVGRVGGLAVALGVGAAVFLGGAGTAFADSDGGEKTSQADADEASEPTVAEKDSEQRSEQGRNDSDAVEDETEAEDADESDDVTDEPESDEPESDEPDAGSDEPAATAPAASERPRRARPHEQETAKPQKRQMRSEPGEADAVTEPDDEALAAVVPDATPHTEQAAPQLRSTVTVEDVAQTAGTPVPQTAAVVTAATAPTAARSAAPVINRLLAAFGLGSLRHLPSLPSPTWAVSALMALASRREVDRTLATRSVTTARPAVALAAAAAGDPAKDYKVTPVGVSSNTAKVTNVTGPGGLNDTVDRFGIGGTDLGIMWDNGIRDNPDTAVNEHQVLIAFGDTFSKRTPVRTGVWRMNTLFRSTDTKLANGMYIADGIPHDPGMYSGSPMSDPNFSREIIGNYHYGIGTEVTMIPTAAISVPGAGAKGATRQYINYMAVKSWDTPGRWTTNYSAIAYSDDNGQNWTVVPRSSVRPAAAGRSTVPFVNGEQNFQQGAYVRKYTVDPVTGKPLKDEAGREISDGYIYSYGTPAGRGGTAYLSRVAEADILDKTEYEYWNGTAWTPGDPAAAKPILPATTTTSFFGLIRTTTHPAVSEMSVQYNSYEKKYLMLYGDKNNNIVMRKADSPEGPWSAPVTLVKASKMPGLYAPMIHPWSSTDNLAAEDQHYLYWNLSTWGDYQVKLMRTNLTKV